ncbi:MAG: lipase family protein [Gammaproteobacteria bacterium]|nr:lipase family protein [Gammaproteobacteria bacterium]
MLKTPGFFIALMLSVATATWASNKEETVNFTEIQKQAIFAGTSYLSGADIHALVETDNYALTRYHTIPDIQMSYFLATNELTKTQIISVRGTSNSENTRVNISLRLQPNKETGILLHQGFSAAAKRVYTELQPLLKTDYKIKTTGHSSGGAVAVILAMYLDVAQFNVEQVITFGQPKVTNFSGATKFQHLNILRVVTPLDPVPLLPPFDSLDINNVEVYWHAGKEIVLLADTQYAILEDLDSMLRATRFTRKLLSEKNLENHRMRFYLKMIGPKTASSRRIPYPTDFNLFNLFSGFLSTARSNI